jgi:hypothetical protein
MGEGRGGQQPWDDAWARAGRLVRPTPGVRMRIPIIAPKQGESGGESGRVRRDVVGGGDRKALGMGSPHEPAVSLGNPREGAWTSPENPGAGIA